MQGVAGAMITSRRLEQLEHLRAIPAAEFLRLSTHGAGTIAPAIRRSRMAGSKSCGTLAQAVEMQRVAFGGGDHVGRGAGAGGLRNFDRLRGIRAPWRRARRLRPLRGIRSSGSIRRQSRSAGRRGPRSSSGVTGSTGRVAHAASSASGPCMRVIGQREIADAARERSEMIEACDKRKRPRPRQPAIGRLEAEDAAERRRHADRAVGVRSERKRNQRTTTALPEPPEEPPLIRVGSCGLRDGPSCTFSPVKS